MVQHCSTAKSRHETPLREALDAVMPILPRVFESETIAIAEASGRVLAEDVRAPVDLPPHDSSAMDGYAIRSADLDRNHEALLRIVGKAAAGHPYQGQVGSGQAVRILTGAKMPIDADRVVEQERCHIVEGMVRIRARAKDNWRRQGEDIRAGTMVFAAGHRLAAFDTTIVAALGIHIVHVRKRLRVGLVSTGDELRNPGEALCPGQIWDANRVFLRSMLERLDCIVQDLGILADDAAIIEARLQAAASDCDLIVTSGGMSVGTEDHLRTIINRRGKLEIWPLAIRPGRPVGFGDIDDCPILALPGNPIAALVAFIAFGRPIVAAMQGAPAVGDRKLRLPILQGLEKNHGIRQILFACIEESGGESALRPLQFLGTGALAILTRADGIVLLPEDCTEVVRGEAVDYVPIDTIMRR